MFKVLFFGTYIPVQGTEYIVRAAKLLEHEDVIFLFAGNGQEKEKTVALARQLKVENTVFYDMLDSERLKREIINADVVLGNFGDTPLAPLVISNKVFEALAMKKPVISSDLSANREFFDANEAVLVPVADPKALADAILKLKRDPEFRDLVARKGHEKFLSHATPNILGAELKTIIQKLL